MIDVHKKKKKKRNATLAIWSNGVWNRDVRLNSIDCNMTKVSTKTLSSLSFPFYFLALPQSNQNTNRTREKHGTERVKKTKTKKVKKNAQGNVYIKSVEINQV